MESTENIESQDLKVPYNLTISISVLGHCHNIFSDVVTDCKGEYFQWQELTTFRGSSFSFRISSQSNNDSLVIRKSLGNFASLVLILPCAAMQNNHTELLYIVATKCVSVFCMGGYGIVSYIELVWIPDSTYRWDLK